MRMMTFREKLGLLIAQMRIEQGLSQTQLCKQTHLAQKYLSDIENGKRNVSLEVLCKISDFFQKPTSLILKEAEEYSNNCNDKY